MEKKCELKKTIKAYLTKTRPNNPNTANLKRNTINKKTSFSSSLATADKLLYKKYSCFSSFPYEQIVNRILDKRLCSAYTSFKEIMAEMDIDISRRYYNRREIVEKMENNWKIYQFHIPKPKIYSKERVKFYYKYFYLKNKFRDEIINKILKEIKDEDVDNLDINYLNQYMKNKKSVLIERESKREQLLIEMFSPSNKNYQGKKLTFGISLSKVIEIKNREDMYNSFLNYFPDISSRINAEKEEKPKNDKQQPQKKTNHNTITLDKMVSKKKDHKKRFLKKNKKAVKSKNAPASIKSIKFGIKKDIDRRKTSVSSVRGFISKTGMSSKRKGKRNKNKLFKTFAPISLHSLPSTFNTNLKVKKNKYLKINSDEFNRSKGKSQKTNNLEISTFKIKLINNPELPEQKTLQDNKGKGEGQQTEQFKLFSTQDNRGIRELGTNNLYLHQHYKKKKKQRKTIKGKFDLCSIFKQNKRETVKRDFKTSRMIKTTMKNSFKGGSFVQKKQDMFSSKLKMFDPKKKKLNFDFKINKKPYLRKKTTE